jgi:hypothetical protein
VGVIDGALVRGSGLAARALAWLGSRAQTGRVGSYAWVVAAGAVVVVAAVGRDAIARGVGTLFR